MHKSGWLQGVVERFKQIARSELKRRCPEHLLLTPPIDVNAVASCLGVKQVMVRELDVPGLLYQLDQDSAVIVVNNANPLTRQRYSCAHEIVHMLLSPSQKVRLSHRSPVQAHKALERACEELAAEILMPQEVFTEYASRMGWAASSIQPLSNVFQTSMEATARRYVEVISEPCVMVMWRLVKTEDGSKTKMTRYIKNRKVDIGEYRLVSPATTESSPVSRCLRGLKSVGGFQRVSITSRKNTQIKSLYSEVMGYGIGANRRAINLIYPGRKTNALIPK